MGDADMEEMYDSESSVPDAEGLDVETNIEIGLSSNRDNFDVTERGEHNGAKPYIGMEFPNIKDAFQFYNAYARLEGFGIRNSSMHRSKKVSREIISKKFVCSKEVRRNMNDKREKGKEVARRRETRVGCKANMVIKFTKSGTWVVSNFTEAYNDHIMTSLNKVLQHRSHKQLHRSKRCRNLIESLHDEGLPPSTISRVINVASGSQEEYVTPQQCHDYLRTQKKNNMGQECIIIAREFQDRRSTDPQFYFAMELDHTGTMRSIFWADGRSRVSYMQLGDVVVFDVTYKTNKCSLPFAPFTGVNHHRQSTLFGCALLADEQEETFIWLFTQWLKCMNGLTPKSIITDQDLAICNAIHRVFSNTRHRFCAWHIGKHVAEHLLALRNFHGEEFLNDYNKWYYSSTTEQTDQHWDELKQKYEINEDADIWLPSMYRKRDHWIPAYLKDTFFTGMTTSQRSESINAFFDTYVHSQTLLTEFVQQYDKAVANRRKAELDEDFKTMNTKPVWFLSHPIEIQAGEQYTRTVFDMFQSELRGCVSLYREEEHRDGSAYLYKITSLCDPTSKWHRVVLDPREELQVNCTCALFETDGIIYKHILHILMFAHQIQKVPQCYILHRWTINVRYRNIGVASVMQGKNNLHNEEQWNVLKAWAISVKFNSALEMVTGSSRLLTKLDTLLADFMTAVENELKSNTIQEIETTSQVGSNAPLSQTVPHSQEISIHDPPVARTKGRPRAATRFQSGLELVQEKKDK